MHLTAQRLSCGSVAAARRQAARIIAVPPLHQQPSSTTACSAVAGSVHRSLDQQQQHREAVKLPLPASSNNGLSSKQNGAPPAVAQQQPPALPSDIKRVLFSAQEVRDKVAEMGAQICQDYKGRQVAIIGVLNGAFIFTSDLAREVSREIPDVRVDFLRASSYGAASESSGAVAVQATSDLSKWADFDILLVEDVIDSGHTLARLSRVLQEAGAASVKVVALLDKKGRRRVECFPDYVGWECPDEFVVGYGLDYNERWRCLPYVAALKEEAYSH